MLLLLFSFFLSIPYPDPVINADRERGEREGCTHTRIQMKGMRVKVEVFCLVYAIESALEVQVSPSMLL